jgi:hypothetical protein
MEQGLGAIAVPIPLPDTGAIYSLGIAGLIDRLTRRPLARSLKVPSPNLKLTTMNHETVRGSVRRAADEPGFPSGPLPVR